MPFDNQNDILYAEGGIATGDVHTDMAEKQEKTNVMRVLDQKKVAYKAHLYGDTGAVSGQEVAAVLGEPVNRVFKTLVTVGKTGNHYVFVVPCDCGLNLKKAAEAVGEKNIEMIKSKELLPLTGYIHGGCSPIGMKKFFKTVFHKTVTDYETVFFSAGKIGSQVEVAPSDIGKVIQYTTADIADPET